jgi:hypothetical protein
VAIELADRQRLGRRAADSWAAVSIAAALPVFRFLATLRP